MARGGSEGSVYDDIAESFDAMRRRAWPETVEFLGALPKGSLVLDVGCGNGRNAEAALEAGHEVVAFDCSRQMLATFRRRCAETPAVLADASAVPFRDRSFDAVLAIAVVHHIDTEEGRVQALREICRVLRPGCTGLVGVWAREQKRLGAKHDRGDVLVDWHLPDGGVRKRFYHLYTERGFRSAVREAGLVERRYFFRCDNHYAVVERGGEGVNLNITIQK